MKYIVRIVLSALIFLAAGCGGPSPGSKADMSGYKGMEDQKDHVFVVSDVDDFLKRMDNKETFVAYFGFDTCPWCISVVPILNNLGKEYSREILYINTRPNKKVTANNEIDGYDRLFSRIKEYWQIDEETGENYLFVPFVIFIKDGEVKESHTGTVDGHMAYINELTDEERDEVEEIYRKGFEAIQ